jgi:hypothetical protein
LRAEFIRSMRPQGKHDESSPRRLIEAVAFIVWSLASSRCVC